MPKSSKRRGISNGSSFFPSRPSYNDIPHPRVPLTNPLSKLSSSPSSIPLSASSSTGKQTLMSTIKESLASGFGAGVGISLADRAVSAIMGPRAVSVQHQQSVSPSVLSSPEIPKRIERCYEEERKLMECIKKQDNSINTRPCRREMDDFYQCNSSNTFRTTADTQ